MGLLISRIIFFQSFGPESFYQGGLIFFFSLPLRCDFTRSKIEYAQM